MHGIVSIKKRRLTDSDNKLTLSVEQARSTMPCAASKTLRAEVSGVIEKRNDGTIVSSVANCQEAVLRLFLGKLTVPAGGILKRLQDQPYPGHIAFEVVDTLSTFELVFTALSSQALSDTAREQIQFARVYLISRLESSTNHKADCEDETHSLPFKTVLDVLAGAGIKAGLPGDDDARFLTCKTWHIAMCTTMPETGSAEYVIAEDASKMAGTSSLKGVEVTVGDAVKMRLGVEDERRDAVLSEAGTPEKMLPPAGKHFAEAD